MLSLWKASHFIIMKQVGDKACKVWTFPEHLFKHNISILKSQISCILNTADTCCPFLRALFSYSSSVVMFENQCKLSYLSTKIKRNKQANKNLTTSKIRWWSISVCNSHEENNERVFANQTKTRPKLNRSSSS